MGANPTEGSNYGEDIMRFAESKEVVAAETTLPIDDIYKERTLRSAADRHIDTVEAVGAAPTGSTNLVNKS